MLAATIFTLTGVFVPIAFWSTRYFTTLPNVGRVKSSVDDLTMERGTVSMRVALCYDLLRFSLCSGICAMSSLDFHKESKRETLSILPPHYKPPYPRALRHPRNPSKKHGFDLAAVCGWTPSNSRASEIAIQSP